jgi:multidrug efflux pump subunit AcrB
VERNQKGKSFNAFRGNYTQQDVMQEVRRRLRKYAPMRTSVRNGRSFNFGTGGRTDIDFVFRGPDIVALAGYADDLVERSEKLGGIVRCRHDFEAQQAELRVRIDRERAADLGVDTSDIATSLRLMVGGEDEASRFRDEQVNEDYDVQLRLTEADRRDADTISRLWVPSSRGGPGGTAGLVRLDNLVKITRDTSPSRIDRLDRERQVSVRASVAPGYALADRIEALRGAVREMNLPIAYTTTVSGRARRARKDVHGVYLGVHPVRDLHVHDSRVAIREHGASVDDPLELAAVGAVCIVVALGNRRHAQSLFGARCARLVWRGEEERDLADRSHEQSAREGGWNVTKRSCRAIGIACVRF